VIEALVASVVRSTRPGGAGSADLAPVARGHGRPHAGSLVWALAVPSVRSRAEARRAASGGALSARRPPPTFGRPGRCERAGSVCFRPISSAQSARVQAGALRRGTGDYPRRAAHAALRDSPPCPR